MKRSLILVPVVATTLLLFNNNTAADTNEAKKETIPTVTTVSSPMVYTVVLPVVDENKRPQYDIPLPDDTLDYLWQRSNISDVPYTMLLAIGKTESNFNINLVSKTDDIGLFQLHQPTAKWIAQELGLERYNLKDAETNIDFMIFYINYLKDYWRQKDFSDERLLDLVIISYHRGIEGTKRYVQAHGYSDPYLNKVKEYKIVYEKGE